MELLNLLSENTEMFVEATNIGIAPSMVGIFEINEAATEESFQLEASMVYTVNKKILAEGADASILNEANVFKNALQSIKNIILKMWGKMKEFYEKVKLFLAKTFSKSSKFASEYESEINGIGSIEVEGYPVKPEAIDLGSMWSSFEAMSKMSKEDTVKAKLDDASKKTVGKESKQFKSGCSEKVGLSGKPTNQSYSGSALVKILKGLNSKINEVVKDQNSVNKSYNGAKSVVDQLIAKVEKSEAEDAKDQKVMLTNEGKFLKEALQLVNIAAGIKVTAYKTEANQAQKAAYKGIAEARKNNKETKKDEKK